MEIALITNYSVIPNYCILPDKLKKQKHAVYLGLKGSMYAQKLQSLKTCVVHFQRCWNVHDKRVAVQLTYTLAEIS